MGAGTVVDATGSGDVGVGVGRVCVPVVAGADALAYPRLVFVSGSVEVGVTVTDVPVLVVVSFLSSEAPR